MFLTILSTIPGNGLAQSHGSAPKHGISLRDGALSVSVDVSSKRFAGLHVHDDIFGRTLDIGEAFVLALKDKTLLRSADMQVIAIPNYIAASDQRSALRTAHQDSPRRATPAGASPRRTSAPVSTDALSFAPDQTTAGRCYASRQPTTTFQSPKSGYCSLQTPAHTSGSS